ncbi:MAG: DNA methyltransferase, partial [Bacteroidia bacterium]|nr:DNA methyltransferase [Bacteroidia bacterium]
GNRRVRGIEIPMDAIVADFFQSLGYLHERTYIRQISNKRMPAENSPTNIPGHKEGTMRYEYLVKLRRID